MIPNRHLRDEFSSLPWRYRLAFHDQIVHGSDLEAARLLKLGKTRPDYAYRPVPQARRFHQSRKRWRFLLGGNRSGKSATLAMETLWAATGLHPWRTFETPSDGWYSTTAWDKVGDTLWEPKLQKLLRGIPHEVAWHNKQRNIPEMVFVQPKDKRARKFWSKITFKSIEAGRESYQAVAVRYIHNDEQFPQDIWIEQNSRIGGDYPLDIACAFTPINPQPWLEASLATDRPPTWDVFELPLDDNRLSAGGFIEDGLIDAMIEMWPPEVRATRRLGKWGAYAGAIFQSFARETHVISEEKERRCFFMPGRSIPPSVCGLDWGGANPFGVVWVAKIPHLDNDWYVFDEYYWPHRERGPRRLADLAADVKATTERWKSRVERTWADHDPSNALEFAHCGVPTMPAIKVGGPDEISRAGIEAIQSMLNPRQHLRNADWPNGRPQLHIAARCTNLIREMSLYRMQDVPDPTKRSPKDVPVKVDDHLVDCLRYIASGERPYSPSLKIPDIGSYARTFR